eukprot:GILI01008836.1.p1 GENE.GILI01008836.1~~GILI01008836.1.p1  ORF type:complete len:932 (+),score=183.45 GILI01008836.1:126-2798(+)
MENGTLAVFTDVSTTAEPVEQASYEISLRNTINRESITFSPDGAMAALNRNNYFALLNVLTQEEAYLVSPSNAKARCFGWTKIASVADPAFVALLKYEKYDEVEKLHKETNEFRVWKNISFAPFEQSRVPGHSFGDSDKSDCGHQSDAFLAVQSDLAKEINALCYPSHHHPVLLSCDCQGAVRVWDMDCVVTPPTILETASQQYREREQIHAVSCTSSKIAAAPALYTSRRLLASLGRAAAVNYNSFSSNKISYCIHIWDATTALPFCKVPVQNPSHIAWVLPSTSAAPPTSSLSLPIDRLVVADAGAVCFYEFSNDGPKLVKRFGDFTPISFGMASFHSGIKAFSVSHNRFITAVDAKTSTIRIFDACPPAGSAETVYETCSIEPSITGIEGPQYFHIQSRAYTEGSDEVLLVGCVHLHNPWRIVVFKILNIHAHREGSANKPDPSTAISVLVNCEVWGEQPHATSFYMENGRPVAIMAFNYEKCLLTSVDLATGQEISEVDFKVAQTDGTNTTTIVDVRNKKSIGNANREVNAVTFNFDGSRIYLGVRQGGVQVFDTKTGEMVHHHSGFFILPTALGLFGDGEGFAAGLHDGSLVVCDELNVLNNSDTNSNKNNNSNKAPAKPAVIAKTASTSTSSNTTTSISTPNAAPGILAPLSVFSPLPPFTTICATSQDTTHVARRALLKEHREKTATELADAVVKQEEARQRKLQKEAEVERFTRSTRDAPRNFKTIFEYCDANRKMDRWKGDLFLFLVPFINKFGGSYLSVSPTIQEEWDARMSDAEHPDYVAALLAAPQLSVEEVEYVAQVVQYCQKLPREIERNFGEHVLQLIQKYNRAELPILLPSELGVIITHVLLKLGSKEEDLPAGAKEFVSKFKDNRMDQEEGHE